MKSTEILQALGLTKEKGTTAYCTKLSMVFEFIKAAMTFIKQVVILETDITINQYGKIISLSDVEADYKERLLSKYREDDKKMIALADKEYSLHGQLRRINETLWKKRRNKNNSELESQRDKLSAEISAIDQEREELLKAESNRIDTMTFDNNDVRKELGLFSGNKIKVETHAGNYFFCLPVDNIFYYAICRMLNIEFKMADADVVKKTIVSTFITYPHLIDNIKKSLRFTSNDDLRPSMTCVCLDFKSEGIQIVSTDAHRMYYSKRVSCEGFKENTQFLIEPESAKKLAKVKFKDDEPLIIKICSDNTADFNGVEVKLMPDTRYPDYSVVIPEYNTFIEFEKSNFVDNVKKVLPYANKSTNQVTLHMNGNIQMMCQDVDFSFESVAQVAHLSKTCPDTDIAFNGQFLIDAISIFKDKSIKMFTGGKATQAAIFTNNTDSVLLMPLMLNN